MQCGNRFDGRQRVLDLVPSGQRVSLLDAGQVDDAARLVAWPVIIIATRSGIPDCDVDIVSNSTTSMKRVDFKYTSVGAKERNQLTLQIKECPHSTRPLHS